MKTEYLTGETFSTQIGSELIHGEWQFRQVGTEAWLPARVPGSVYTDLMENKRIPDPYFGDNEKRVQWVAENDWEYRHHFSCTPDLIANDRVYLVCEGLDTLATVVLNGHELGETDNMFRRYEWEVKSLLKVGGENVLSVTFASPVKYITEKQAKREMVSPDHSIAGGPYLRKAPCQFGWDWGPKLPTIGIWKAIRLEGYNEARITDVHLRQEHKDGKVTVEARVKVEQWGKLNLKVMLTIGGPIDEDNEIAYTGSAAVAKGSDAMVSVPIQDPQLWWPNGYGGQPLYAVHASLVIDDRDGKKIDRWDYYIGLRTIVLRQQEDQWGHSFEFVVNGVAILAKGSDWIPADSFPRQISPERMEHLIRSAAESHQNMLRVWGGGFYEEELFYSLCDEYGILVWQDFIFSCSAYPLYDPEFLENVHQEVIQNVRRLRHRASLALWCGNNEMEWGWVEWQWDRPDLQAMKAIYDQFFHHTLKDWCLAEDPDHTYWPSSPSSDTPFVNPNGQLQGDTHYWDVWHKGKPFTAYRDQYPRFMSEFGFQSLPPLETIRTYANEEDWNMTSYIMEQHQKNANGNALMVRQMLDTFRLPKDFESLVYLSMVLQAEGIRYGVEHWRRYPERVAGILYWQLNDCWPVASWSSLDYYGRWKALHYAAKRFYAPVMLSIEDNPPEMAVYVSNDLLTEWNGVIAWSLETVDGKSLDQGSSTVKALPQSAVRVSQLDFSDKINDDNLRNLIFVTELIADEQVVSRQVAPFVPIKHLELHKPTVNWEMDVRDGQLFIDLESSTLALLVELSLAGMDGVFSDNYFGLPAGRRVQVTCPLPKGWSLEQARQALKVYSVYDSFKHQENDV